MEMTAVAAPAWGEMETDCLAHVFRRLALEDLAAAAPLVCRGWRHAAADPSLWRALDLRHDHVARFMPWAPLAAAFARHYGVARFTFAGFLRLCLARAGGSVSDLALSPLLSSPVAAMLDRVAVECPRLRRLTLPPLLSADDEARLPELIRRWRLLQHLEFESKPSSFPAVAAQLGTRCPDISSLKTSGSIKPEDAAAIATSLSGLRSLCLDSSYLPKQVLLAILSTSPPSPSPSPSTPKHVSRASVSSTSPRSPSTLKYVGRASASTSSFRSPTCMTAARCPGFNFFAATAPIPLSC